ncbi:DUF3658 domain-containing protein [Neobacillus drentensis]|uniref:DUF3658 domain-containing protein n=1 Tax=Neobacillus drentensis TaxID=220684 RepID=UPI003B586A32
MLANPLTREERMILKREWELLVQSKEVLRLWKNRKVTSVIKRGTKVNEALQCEITRLN